MNVLVDTSVWSLALRRKSEHLNAGETEAVRELARLVDEGRSRLTGLVRQELLSGIKVADQFEKLREALRAFPDEIATTDDHEAAAKGSNDCRSKGIAPSLVDVLLCTMALRRDWAFFSTDADFTNYRKAIPFRVHEVRM